MKIILATAVLLSASAPAFAGPFVNIENKAKFVGDDYGSAVTHIHAGYAFDSGLSIEGGPAFLSTDGEEGTREYSSKVKYNTKLNEDLKLYGEVSAMTQDREFEFNELKLATKVGLTYNF